MAQKQSIKLNHKVNQRAQFEDESYINKPMKATRQASLMRFSPLLLLKPTKMDSQSIIIIIIT